MQPSAANVQAVVDAIYADLDDLDLRALSRLVDRRLETIWLNFAAGLAAAWEPVARAHGRRFGAIRPANTLVEARLVGDYEVEIEAEITRT